MNLRVFVQTCIAGRPIYVQATEAAIAAAELGLSDGQFCDAYSKEVADGYRAEVFTWSEGDTAMNALWGYIITILSEGGTMPDYSLGVFLAFDEAEMVHERDRDAMTTELLNRLDKYPV